MTIRSSTNPTGAGCSRLGAALRRSPAFIGVLRMVEQRDGGRVSATGDEG